MPVLESFPGEQEERLVLDHRSADVRAVLVLNEGRPRDAGAVAEEVVGVERPVAQEFVEIAVDLVGTGLGGQVDDASGKAAELGAYIVRHDPEFLDSVGGRH